jgi:gp16 family phage-associated protein
MEIKVTIADLARVRALIDESGVSISEWARSNGFAAGLVYAVLKGKRKCQRGQSYRIAVALGLREGIPLDVDGLSAKLRERVRIEKPSSVTTQETNM